MLVLPHRISHAGLVGTLVRMEKSHVDFLLTGSRFFNTHNEDSDWDFFIKPTILPEILRDLGFGIVEPMTLYEDSNTLRVWEHWNLPIHVQVVNDVELKVKAQEILASLGADLDKDKIARTTIVHRWNIAMDLAKLELNY